MIICFIYSKIKNFYNIIQLLEIKFFVFFLANLVYNATIKGIEFFVFYINFIIEHLFKPLDF